LENIKLSHSLNTKHEGNLFCAEISPIDGNLMVTAAADGFLYGNYLDNSSVPSVLHQSRELIHMFSFDVENGNILYTAEDCGHLHRIDLRVPALATGRKEVH